MLCGDRRSLNVNDLQSITKSSLFFIRLSLYTPQVYVQKDKKYLWAIHFYHAQLVFIVSDQEHLQAGQSPRI